MCDDHEKFRELCISTHKQINSFPVYDARCCVLTHDNKYLITATHVMDCDITKWSLRSKKELHTWRSGVDKYISS